MARLTGAQRRKNQAETKSNRKPAITIKKGIGGGQGNKKRNSSDSSDKAAWLKKTRNSPAAKAGISDDMRWKAYQKNQKGKSSTTKSSTKKSGFFSKKEPIKNLGKNTKVTSSKGKTTYETSERAKGIAGFFGKKNKKKLTVPNLPNLK